LKGTPLAAIALAATIDRSRRVWGEVCLAATGGRFRVERRGP
jgi:hypothetical protein